MSKTSEETTDQRMIPMYRIVEDTRKTFRCIALWKTYCVKCTTEDEEETEAEEGRKRGNWGTIRQTCPGHVARVKMREEMTGPSAKGRQKHLG